MNNKLKDKLIELCKTKRLKYWNGYSTKQSVVGNSNSKIFQVNKIKYKLELRGEVSCDNTTGFVPQEFKPILCDWKECRLYYGYNNISNFLQLPAEDIVEIWAPLLEQSKYNDDEIKLSVKQYQEFMFNFRENFCLDL